MTTESNVITPAHSKESEMMVLGCMLTNVNAFHLASDMLEGDDFFYVEHKTIFQALKAAHRDNKPADVHLICEELKRNNKLGSVGGAGYIMTLAQYVGTSAYIEEYAQEMIKYSTQRHVAKLFENQRKKLLDGADPSKIAVETQEALRNVERRGYTKEQFPLGFISQIDKDYLLKEPSKKPMLLEYADEDGSAQGFLPKGTVGMLVGAGGVGKSHLLAQLAISVASGTRWLNRFSPTPHCGKGNKGSVFLGFGENTDEDIQRILYKASRKLRQQQPDITKDDPIKEASARIAPFSFCGQQAAFVKNREPSQYYRGLKMRLIELAPKDGWSLIILDPVSRLLGADAETDNAAATQFIALLEELTLDLPGNPTVLFAHHVNKSALAQGADQNQASARGSSALTDGVRWQCNVARADKLDDSIILKMTKTNFTKFASEIKLQKEIDGFLTALPEDQTAQSTKSTQKIAATRGSF